MVWNEIKPNEANIVAENHLLVTKMRRKRSCPDKKGQEETEEKEGKWKSIIIIPAPNREYENKIKESHFKI